MEMMLRNYQNAVIDAALGILAENDGCALFLDCGLGKTAIAIELAKRLDAQKILVIAPPRVARLTWPSELEKFRADAKKFTLLSVDNLRRLEWIRTQFDLIILDESSRIKNPSAKRFRHLRKFLKTQKSAARMILSGTPTPNTLLELWPQIYILDQGEALGKTLTEFRDRYATPVPPFGKWRLRDGAAAEIAEQIKHLAIYLSAEGNIDLPDLIENIVEVELPGSSQAAHKLMKRELFARLEQDRVLAPNSAVALNKCRQIAQGFLYDENGETHFLHNEKLSAMEELVASLNGEQALISYCFQEDRRRLLAVFAGGIFDAAASPDNIEKWLAGEKQLLLLHESSAYGLNLQTGGCHQIIFYDQSWSAELQHQMLSRLRRPGGARVVITHKILAKNTVNYLIADRVAGKLKSQDDFLAALKSWSTA